MLDGETYAYDFYASSETHVHPSLGRLAFLLETNGVKLHWVTASEDEWTGLKPDNSIDEPLSRRGPRNIPLKPDQWNRVSMTIVDSKVSVKLNEIEIYHRPIGPGDDTRPGLFHDPSTYQIRVRGATLRGDWPTTVHFDSINDPNGPITNSLVSHTRKVFPESDVNLNVRRVLQRASALPLPERYDLLVRWVCPNAWHNNFRLNGFFRPIHIAPEQKLGPNDEGGQLIAPAIELVKTAKQLGKLPELLRTVKQTVTPLPQEDDETVARRDRTPERCAAALAALIHQASNDDAAVEREVRSMFELYELQTKLKPDQHWPEILVARELSSHQPSRAVRRNLLTLLQPWTFANGTAIGCELMRELNRLRVDEGGFDQQPQVSLGNWIPTSRYHAMKGGEGRSAATWRAIPGEVRSTGGYGDDLLIYSSPLLGDYEVQFETSSRAYYNSEAFVAGERTLVRPWGSVVEVGSEDRGFNKQKITPQLTNDGSWWHHRYVVKDGVCTTYFNGQAVGERKSAGGFPWLAIVHKAAASGGVRDFRITGNPSIPDELQLSTEGMPGWRPYYTYSFAWSNNKWLYRDGVMIGQPGQSPRGSADEMLLYYQRPMSEDGTIRYQYYYSPESFDVSPALGRTAFLLRPNGVAEHHVTNGYYDTTYFNKENARVIAANQRSLPGDCLRENAWNDVEVSVRGDTVSLKLNDQLVYASPITKSNTRLFGLFYFTDQTSAQVKNVIFRGQWPKQLPSVSDQVLADPDISMLDATREQLASEFNHDFSEGLKDGLISFNANARGSMSVSERGLSVSVGNVSEWTQTPLTCALRIMGDFDITADFEDLKVEGNNPGSIYIGLPLGTPEKHSARLTLHTSKGVKRNVHAQIHTNNVARDQKNKPSGWSATSGTLRLARRGTVLYALAKNSGSQNYRLVSKLEVPDAAVQRVSLLTVAHRTLRSSVTWRNLAILAQKIGVSNSNRNRDRRILVMDADSKNLVQLTHTMPGTGHGSPEFSPNGKLIAYDIFNGSGSKSRIMLVDAQGGESIDIGNGSMPTFTPDGKRIVCSAGEGMIIMDIDGKNREVISRSGWGVQLTPDGKHAVFVDYLPQGPNWALVNMKTKTKRHLFTGAQVGRYRQLYWNSDWSSDSSELAFCGINATNGKLEIAVININGSSNGFRVLRSGDEYKNGVAWHPDGDKLTVLKMDPVFGTQLSFTIKRSDPDFEEPLSVPYHAQTISDSEWSRDGKRIAFSGIPPQTFLRNPTSPKLNQTDQ